MVLLVGLEVDGERRSTVTSVRKTTVENSGSRASLTGDSGSNRLPHEEEWTMVLRVGSTVEEVGGRGARRRAKRRAVVESGARARRKGNGRRVPSAGPRANGKDQPTWGGSHQWCTVIVTSPCPVLCARASDRCGRLSGVCD
jgi:hypothetical protein